MSKSHYSSLGTTLARRFYVPTCCENTLFLWSDGKMHLYVSLQIPPAPPRPDFDASREKLQKLGEGEGTMTKEEFQKMKAELEA